MSGLLANLVGAATAALNLRSQDSAPRAPKSDGPEGGFASVLSAALTPRQRSETRAAAAADDAAEGAALAEADAEVALADAAAAAGADAGTEATAGGSTVAAGAGAAAPAAEAEDAAGTEAPGEVAAAGAVAGPEPAGPSPTAVSRSLEALNPEFRARLERVIERMEKEHGHDVRIVETVRDQARQNHLFEQGRSRPGPVVTWTKSSNHTRGRAADLIVDGTYDNPLAMVRLARIAREEGLRTLGSKDPGHVELPAGVRVERLAVGADATTSLLDSAAARGAEAVRAATVAQTPGMSGAPGVARVARGAQLAGVAQVARVATVGRVATPGPIGGGAAIEAPVAPTVAPEQLPAAVPGQLASSEGNLSNDGGRREGRSPNREPVMEAPGEASPRTTTGNPFGFESRTATALAAEARGAPAGFGAEAAERIARVLQLQDTAPTRPLSQMVLRLDNAMGGEDRIRVDLRGGSVGAALNVGDPVTAARLQSELGQLQRALEGRGLQAEHLSVTATAGRELVDAAMRSAVPTDQGQRSSQDSDSRREGWNGRPGGRQQDADSEQPQQRQRRNLQQERNT